MANYNDPIIYNWHYNEQTGEKYSVKLNNEMQTVINGRIFLNQIPDKFHAVEINGMTEKDLVVNVTDYKVDYTNGMVTFHTSKEGQQVTVTEYYGRGVVIYPASRIWTDIGSMGEVRETLKDVLDLLGNANTLKDEVAETVANLTTLINSPEFAQKVTEASEISSTLIQQVQEIEIVQVGIENAVANSQSVLNSIDSANTEASNNITLLNSAIQLAKNTKTELENVNVTANGLVTTLTGLISSANTIKANLDTSSTSATSIYNQLTTKVTEAQTALTNLESAIHSADLNNYITIQMLDLRLNDYIKTVNTLAETTDNGIWIVTNE